MLRIHKWMTIMAVVAIAFANFVISTTPVFACSCAPPPPPQEARDGSAAVFAGMVTDITAPEGEVMSSADPVQVTFSVSDVWKGPVSPTLAITTPRDSASCGASFTLGADYLVYAYEGENGLETNLCSRTTQLSADLEDLSVLGESSVPEATVPEVGEGVLSPAATSLWPYFLFGLVGIAIVGFIVVMMLGRRRQTAAGR